MNILNIAVWTIGNHSIRNILPAIEENTFFNLVGIYTRNKKNLDVQSHKYNCKGYLSSNDLLEDKKVDLVYISSPNALHFKQTINCLSNNKHVLVEKSAFISFKESKKIIKIANEKKLIVMEAFMYLFHNQFFELKRILDSKKYGEILSVEAKFGFPHLGEGNIRYSKDLGGGALNDAGAYTISAILNLLGFNSELIFSSLISDTSYEVDTSGIALFKNNNIPTSKGACFWAFGASYKNEITIWCEHGNIIVERAFSKPPEHEAKIEIFNNSIKVEDYKSRKENHFIAMLDFCAEKIINKDFYEENNKVLIQSSILENIRNSINK
jgi:dTDP-3,4-didehydro-2,6-dideoxy-alpha-D-glucose 3-reductase